MNYAEQIAAFEAKSLANANAMQAIMQKAADEGSTLDAAQQEEFDGLVADNEAIASHLGRLKAAEKAAGAKATPVEGKTMDQGTQSRAPATVKAAKPEAGIGFAQYAKTLGLAHIMKTSPVEIARERYGADSLIAQTTKAVVSAGSTGNWAGALVGAEGNVFADFAEFLRPQLLLTRFGQGGVPGFRTVPYRTPLISQTEGGDAYWTAEGAGKGLTAFDFTRTTLEPYKIAAITPITEEVLLDSSPAADGIVRDQLAAAIRGKLDVDFLNPAKALVPNVSPASILNGVAPIASSGSDADAVRRDVQALFGAFVAANNAPTSGVFVMNTVTALSLSMMTNPLGQSEFAGIGMNGGTFYGLPVVTSNSVPAGLVALINASDIFVGPNNEVRVDVSNEASLQMRTDPTQNSVTPTGSELVSLWQTNTVAFRGEIRVGYMRRRETSVAYLTGVAWGAPAEGGE